MKKWKWHVYIIECMDGSYYVGMTWKPEIRYEQHLSGFGGKYTAKHGVRKQIYLEEYENYQGAKIREKQLKGWTREKKEKLIRGEWKKL